MRVTLKGPLTTLRIPATKVMLQSHQKTFSFFTFWPLFVDIISNKFTQNQSPSYHERYFFRMTQPLWPIFVDIISNSFTQNQQTNYYERNLYNTAHF